MTDRTRLRWRKAKRSASNGSCVEMADAGETIAVRDSKFPDGAVLHFTRPEIEAWLNGAKKGEFDDLA